jgi:hypothetical protein
MSNIIPPETFEYQIDLKRMKTKIITQNIVCPYCEQFINKSDTCNRDHVFGKCVVLNDEIPDLLKIKTHQDCNTRKGKIEHRVAGYFMLASPEINILSSPHSLTNRVCLDRLRGGHRWRFIENCAYSGERKLLANNSIGELVDIPETDSNDIKSLLPYYIRGLYFLVHGRVLGKETNIRLVNWGQFATINGIQNWNVLQKGNITNVKLGYGKQRIKVQHAHLIDDPHTGWWIFLFNNNIVFSVMTESREWVNKPHPYLDELEGHTEGAGLLPLTHLIR